MQIKNIPLAKIDPTAYPNVRQLKNPRYADILASIRRNGLEQPIVVAPHPDKARAAMGFYGVIAGFTRYDACRELKHAEIPCHVKEGADSFDTFAENNDRSDLHPAEVCAQIMRWIGEGFEQKKIAERTGLTSSSVSNYVRVGSSPIFGAWCDSVFGGRPAPGFKDVLLLLGRFGKSGDLADYKKGLPPEERKKAIEEKMLAVYGTAQLKAAERAKEREDSGGKGKRGKGDKGGGSRTSVQPGSVLGQLMRDAEKVIKAIETGDKETAGELGSKDVPWLRGIADACAFAIKKTKKAPLILG